MASPLQKPRLNTYQLFNMSVGFLGIQFGLALQNSNASRILQTFGADVEHLSLFWLAAPITGMIIQPIIGHYSDRTWTRLGRRRPYFLVGALIAACTLVVMPHAGMFSTFLSPMLIGAGMLMILDASINVAMEPFRALVADKLPLEQRSAGFSMQSFLIGVGAVIGSFLPFLLAEYVGFSKTASPGVVPDNVVYSFYFGAFILVITILWTVFSTKEYTPEELLKYNSEPIAHENRGLSSIFFDFLKMPQTMKELGIVQFFSWFALFSMWVFFTPAIAQHVYKVMPHDTSSVSYANAGNWTGILFGVYNAVAAIFALFLPSIVKKTSIKWTHATCLIAGGIGLLSVYFIQDPNLLILPMIGVGLAWGSILSLPYAMLSATIPPYKMGVYIGLFNFFITIPQILNGFLGGWIIAHVFDGQAIFALVIAGITMLFAAVSVSFIKNQSNE
ncbi:MFS transporter [Sphingobacterium tabacisoli]|uniref:MFS transporter n=1 Tax=Sphingobacterium tabacisoli TaxID=2044855 RepID=A0ABW5L7L1_9SPHI|nr:MFS transporter [Sphingobacterium tabacisoli]